jgi:hypothetical protein
LSESIENFEDDTRSEDGNRTKPRVIREVNVLDDSRNEIDSQIQVESAAAALELHDIQLAQNREHN